MTDLLRWRGVLHWQEELGTVTFLELALDFEEFSEGTLPAAPQAQYMDHTLSLQERGHVPRLALTHL